MGSIRCWLLGVASLFIACEAPHVDLSAQRGPLSLVLIHTADLHSHLFPEPLQVNSADAARGLGPAGKVSSVGGFARLAHIVNDIRAGAEHTLYLDSGDLIEGSAAFTEFHGEPELRALTALQLGAAALGNHDLDPGAEAFVLMHHRFAQFPTLAANFADNGSELSSALAASVLLDANGIKVGVIGVANPNSPSGLERAQNAFGVELVPLAAAVQGQIDALRSKSDLLVLLSHLGLTGDEALIRGTTGLDVVLGGHQHLALDPALEREDCGPALEAERGCEARRVILVHSGALGRYVGELDLSLAPAPQGSAAAPGLEVEFAAHLLLPVSADIREDPGAVALLDPYRARLEAAGYGTKVGFALGEVERYGRNGGDSALGNLITDAIREQTSADLVIINTTGIRASLPPGEITRSALIAALPFGDTLTRITLTGAQLDRLFAQLARVASSRACESPIQLSGLEVQFTCAGSRSSAMVRLSPSGIGLEPAVAYQLVTSTYLADGGSGFELPVDAPRQLLELDPLDALLNAIERNPGCSRSSLPCIDPAQLRDGRIVVNGG